MKVVFKNTVFDILISKASLYLLLFGTFLVMNGYGLKLIVIISPEDVAKYQNLIYLHIFLYIFYVAILVNASSDLEEEVNERFHEVALIYISRIKYFFTKYISYLLSYLLLLILIGSLATVLSRILFRASPDWIFFLGLTFLSLNIAFLIALLLLFSLKGSPKRVGSFVFLLSILFSLLNSKTVVNSILGSDKISKIISTVSPSFFWLQNEFLKFGLGMGLSDKFWQHLLNQLLYIILLLFALFYRMKRYECKA